MRKQFRKILLADITQEDKSKQDTKYYKTNN